MQARLDDMKINNIKPDAVKYKKKQLSLPRGMGSQSGAYKKSVTHREDALADVTDIVQKKIY
jgi:hypothetical protein